MTATRAAGHGRGMNRKGRAVAQARTLSDRRPFGQPLLWASGLALLALFAGLQTARAEETIVAHGISTYGDLKYPADFKHLDYVNPDAPKGGEIAEATYGTFDSFNPYSIKGRAAALSNIAYEDMMTSTADEIGTLYCLLCATVEYDKEKTWAIFTLRPEAKFSDGTPVTAEDALFSYELLRDQGLLSFRKAVAGYVTSAEVLPGNKIKYTFKPDSAANERVQIVGGLPVMSKAWYEKTGAKLDETRLEPGIGSGPYLLDHFDINRRVVYKRNPDYWGKDLPINVGRNNFDTIRIEYFGDPTAAFEGFKVGEFTFRSENSAKNWATAYDFDALKNGWVVKSELPKGTIASGQGFVFNLRRDKFQDIRVRQAISMMFNFEWSNETLFYGLYARINSFWENTEMAASGLPSAEELALLEPLKDQLAPGVLDQEPVMGATSGATQLDRRNARAAGKLLDEAGWTVGNDGIRRNDKGETLKVEFLEDDPSFDRVVNPFIENLRAIGIDATLSRVDSSQYTDRSRKFDFDIITDQLTTGYEAGGGLRQTFGSEGFGDAFNSMGLQNPAVDSLIETAIRAETRPEMIVATHALDRELRALRFWIPQWYSNKYLVAYYDVFGHPETLPPYALGEMDFWWYDAEKAEKLKAAGAL